MPCKSDIPSIGPVGYRGVPGIEGPAGPDTLAGPMGPIIPIGSIIFDGGFPSTDFTPGPNVDCGGVN